MRIVIAVVGRLKEGPERELFDRYLARTRQIGRGLGLAPLDVAETMEGRAATPAVRRADEAGRLLKLAAGCDVVVGLDEAGQQFDSRAFAAMIARHRDAGATGMAFLAGGADGHGDEVRSKARLLLSLGAMTLPHGLVRIVLAEQIYRAATILAGHPYHRA